MQFHTQSHNITSYHATLKLSLAIQTVAQPQAAEQSSDMSQLPSYNVARISQTQLDSRIAI